MGKQAPGLLSRCVNAAVEKKRSCLVVEKHVLQFGIPLKLVASPGFSISLMKNTLVGHQFST